LENEVFENAASSAAAAERAMNPRSTLIGYVASAKPVAAMLAGQLVAVLSMTRPLAGFVSCRL
jgi:hypothetical protein